MLLRAALYGIFGLRKETLDDQDVMGTTIASTYIQYGQRMW